MLYFTLGILVLLVVVADILKTALSSQGGGTVTNAVSRAVWIALFSAARRNARSSVLNYAGMTVLLAVLLSWVAMLWLGLFLLLVSDTGSVVSSQGAATGPLEKLYYAGFSLSTLGVGDYKATGDGWRITTSAFAFAGLVLITTSITYFVPILSAVNLQSKISLYIYSMGENPQEILQNTWNGKDFSAFISMVPELTDMLFQHQLHHRSYPVLHYFHNTDPSLSAKRSIVQLAETLSLLKYGVQHNESETGKFQLMRLEGSINAYLDTVTSSYVREEKERGAPTPAFKRLKECGIPLHADAHIAQCYSGPLRTRRNELAALLSHDGWSWNDVYGTELTAGD